MSAELIEKLHRNKRFYEREAEAMRPIDCRNMGPSEAAMIAELLRDALSLIEGGSTDARNDHADQSPRP